MRFELIRMSDFARCMDSSGNETSLTLDIAFQEMIDACSQYFAAFDRSHIATHLSQTVGDDLDEFIDPIHH